MCLAPTKRLNISGFATLAVIQRPLFRDPREHSHKPYIVGNRIIPYMIVGDRLRLFSFVFEVGSEYTCILKQSPIKVIQGRLFWYKSKVRRPMQLPISPL